MSPGRGLGTLEVGVRGQDRVPVLAGEPDHRSLEAAERLAGVDNRVFGVHPQVEGDLIVAAAPGVKLAADFGAQQLMESALDGGVDVLVAIDELEAALVELFADALQAPDQLLGIGTRDDPGGAQHASVGDAAGDVLSIEAAVYRQRAGEVLDRPRRAGCKTAPPEARVPGAAGVLGGRSLGLSRHRGPQRLRSQPRGPLCRRAAGSAVPRPRAAPGLALGS